MSERTAVAAVSIQLMAQSDAASAPWIHLLPAGTFTGRDGRGPYKLSNAAAVIASTREHAGSRLMPVDYDHATDLAAPNGGAAPAAGWIDALQARSDGIWGRVAWTPRAAEQIANLEYRYLSPVFRHANDGTVGDILRASLTNNPNLNQLTALASMETAEMDKLPELRALLGLPDDADMDAILAKIRELTTSMQASQSDPSKWVKIGDFEKVVSEVNRLNQGISLHAATDHVTAHVIGGRLPPFLKDWGISLCSVNKPAFDKFMERTGGKFAAMTGPSGATGAPPTSIHAAQELDDDELAIASRMGLSAEEFRKTKTVASRKDERR